MIDRGSDEVAGTTEPAVSCGLLDFAHGCWIEPDTASAWLVPSASPWNGGTDASGLLTVGPGQFVLSPGSGFTIAKTGTTNTQVRARRAYL